MKRKLIGNGISSFGLGITVSSIVYPLGYMDAQSVFYVMLSVGATLLIAGKILGGTSEKTNNKPVQN
ncbi:hypothetical protein RJD24_08130 [Bacillaceae bacterium IKA-2]|nr:hypothetical protein RJD24_08130 [Bacillaceae bacterium IKA-2]